MTAELAAAAGLAAVALFAGGVERFRSLARRGRRIEAQVAALTARAQEAERRAEALDADRQALTAAVSDAILAVDSSGACRVLNRPAAALFGEDTSARSLLALTQSAEIEELVARVKRLPDSSPACSEVVLQAFGDRAMRVSVAPVGPRASGGYIVVLRDVSGLRRLETVRRDFVANVSHELRTPLASVKAMAETLQSGAFDDPGVAGHFLDTIIRETDRLARLTSDLLDLSRIELRPVHKAECDIAELIESAVSHLAGRRREAGIELTSEIERPLISQCDADEIAQVLLNLIDNAIKYTPRGGAIRISGKRIAGEVKVEVADTGIGILKQDIPRLFERFYRVDKARSRESGGTGLGLSIVRHIVERHGGRLWVRSEYNRGSVFGFSLRDGLASYPADDPEQRQTGASPGRDADYFVVGPGAPAGLDGSGDLEAAERPA